MTNATRVEVKGDDELAASLKRAADDIGDMSDALDDAGQLVEQRARSGAPVDTGALANSIAVARSGVEILVGPGIGDAYPGVQEFGSSTTPAHPYLRPALDYSEVIVTGFFTRDADKALSHVKGA